MPLEDILGINLIAYFIFYTCSLTTDPFCTSTPQSFQRSDEQLAWFHQVTFRGLEAQRFADGAVLSYITSSMTSKSVVSCSKCSAPSHLFRERRRERADVSLPLPSSVSSVATSASSTGLSHHAVGVSFVLPPIFIVLANHCPLPSCSHDAPVMHQKALMELVSLKEWVCL